MYAPPAHGCACRLHPTLHKKREGWGTRAFCGELRVGGWATRPWVGESCSRFDVVPEFMGTLSFRFECPLHDPDVAFAGDGEGGEEVGEDEEVADLGAEVAELEGDSFVFGADVDADERA
jgi:hypothetical protein